MSQGINRKGASKADDNRRYQIGGRCPCPADLGGHTVGSIQNNQGSLEQETEGHGCDRWVDTCLLTVSNVCIPQTILACCP